MSPASCSRELQAGLTNTRPARACSTVCFHALACSSTPDPPEVTSPDVLRRSGSTASRTARAAGAHDSPPMTASANSDRSIFGALQGLRWWLAGLEGKRERNLDDAK